jgi:hypothetical protein
MADIQVPGLRKYWTQTLTWLNSQSRAITNKFPEVGSVVQQVYKVPSDIEILAGCIPAKVWERVEYTSIVNSVEENRTNVCKSLDGKLLLSPLYGMYTVTNEGCECTGQTL